MKIIRIRTEHKWRSGHGWRDYSANPLLLRKASWLGARPKKSMRRSIPSSVPPEIQDIDHQGIHLATLLPFPNRNQKEKSWLAHTSLWDGSFLKNWQRRGSVSVCFWASWIRILLSWSKNSKKNLDLYYFVTSLWLFIFKKRYKCAYKKWYAEKLCWRLEGQWRK